MSFEAVKDPMFRVLYHRILEMIKIFAPLFPVNRNNLFILFSLATKAGSAQQREPITVGPYYLSRPVNFPCAREPEYPEKTQDIWQSVDYAHFTWGLGSSVPY